MMNAGCPVMRRNFGEQESSSVRLHIFRVFLVKRASAGGAKVRHRQIAVK
jgi:hypothetical protein